MLGKVEEELEPFFKLWNMISDFHASRKEWLHGSFLGEEHVLTLSWHDVHTSDLLHPFEETHIKLVHNCRHRP